MSALACGTTLVLYDGFAVSIRIRVHCGTWPRRKASPSSARAPAISCPWRGAPSSRAERLGLGALRAVLSTGSPLPAGSYGQVLPQYQGRCADRLNFRRYGHHFLFSHWGCPILPVYPGEIQCLGLAMRVEIFDEAGRSLRGGPGELVCTAAFPSMPLGFWNDRDGRAYRAAYFERYPSVWHHGDHAEITEHQGMIILGRSDAMLKPGGVRIGTGELYFGSGQHAGNSRIDCHRSTIRGRRAHSALRTAGGGRHA